MRASDLGKPLGVFAVVGTYYVQAAATVGGLFPVWVPGGTISLAVVVASLPAATLSTAILNVNNIRDIETDRTAGKRTLAVILGDRLSRLEYAFMVGTAYVVPVVFALDPAFSLPALLPLVTLPLAVSVTRTVLTQSGGDALDPALERTGQVMVAHATLFAVGLAAPAVI